MESDAKLGLLAGLAGVVAVAVVYFQKPTETGVAANLPDATAAGPALSTPPGVSTPGESPAKPRLHAKPTGYTKPKTAQADE